VKGLKDVEREKRGREMTATTDEALLSDLRSEIERLSRELDLASTEKIQSAQYGLALLEEKSTLQQRCNELEGLYENTKHELDITQEVSSLLYL
jgi:protein bicaudal D